MKNGIAGLVRSNHWNRDRVVGFLVFIPAFLTVVIIGVYPIIRVLGYSFFRVDIFFKKNVFIGLGNYIRVLQWSDFWSALQNDIVFTVSSIVLQLMIGLLVALLLHEAFPGRDISRSAILFSYLVPIVVAALVWRYMLNDIFGIMNYLVDISGLPIPKTWLSSPKTAMPTVIMINVWKFFPFMVITFLAQLQSISPTLYEAAKIDGSSRWQEFYFITLPALKPVIFIVLMLRSIWTFNNFDLIYLLTKGGPLGTTETPPLLIYRTVFGSYNLGKGAALAAIMFVLLAGLSIVYLKLYERAQAQLVGE